MEERLQPRIAAGLLDLLLLAGLFLILGLTVGEASWADRTLGVTLTNEQVLLFLALAFGYHFALEATTGQTVGKRLLALRVVRARGGRPSAWAVAVRTALRIVDILPFAYVVGFVTMIATRDRRQRLGDLAARTIVTRAQPARRRSLALAPLVLVLLAVVGLVWYRANWPDTKTYRAHGISFDYPATWHEGEAEIAASTGDAERLWTAAVGPATGFDSVGVSASRLRAPAPEPLGLIEADLRRAVLRSYSLREGELQAGPEDVTVDGMPGLRFRGTFTAMGHRVESTIVLVFAGTTGYQFDCQHTPEGAAEVRPACDLLLRTFRVTTPIPTPAPTTPVPTTSEPAPTTPRSLTTEEEVWLAAIPVFLRKVDRAFPSENLYLTPRKLRELAAVYRDCRRRLAHGPPSERLQPVYRLVLRGCAEYEKGAKCFATLAGIEAPVPGSAADRAYNRTLDCGFDAQRKGAEGLADALNESEKIKLAAGD